MFPQVGFTQKKPAYLENDVRNRGQNVVHSDEILSFKMRKLFSQNFSCDKQLNYRHGKIPLKS